MNIVRAAWLCLLVAPLIHAQSAPNQVHTPPQSDPGVYSGRLKVDYPTRYEPATIEEVRAVLERVHAYLEPAAPLAVVNAVTGGRCLGRHVSAPAAWPRPAFHADAACTR